VPLSVCHCRSCNIACPTYTVVVLARWRVAITTSVKQLGRTDTQNLHQSHHQDNDCYLPPHHEEVVAANLLPVLDARRRRGRRQAIGSG